MSYPHWQYFIAIESDLENTARYVEIAQDNFRTYSIEYARILLSASSEVDVISKLLCQRIAPSGSYRNINDYRVGILSLYTDFDSFEITVPRYGLVIKPWEAWGKGQNPSWWSSHNNVKHERHLHFGEANLENALNAVSGLFCLVLAYYADDQWKIRPRPRLLKVEKDMLVAKVFK